MTSVHRPTESDFDIDNYDEFYEHHYFGAMPEGAVVEAHRFLPRVAWALDIAREVKPKSILDLGCLEGYAVLTLLNKLQNAEGWGVDLSQEGIDTAIEHAKNYRLNARFTRKSIEDFMAGHDKEFKYDFIMLFEIIEHVKDPVQVLKLIKSIATPDATILISTPDFEAPTYGKNDVNNKCHVRLYTTKDEDFEEMTDAPDPDTGKPYMRTATSMSKQVEPMYEIISMDVFSELIHARLQPK